MSKQNNVAVYQVGAILSTNRLPLMDIDRWLSQLLAKMPPHIWLLSGPVGAGKTTLVQRLAGILGVSGVVTSPTFALQKVHRLHRQPWQRLVHVDAYRIRRPVEAAALEIEEYVTDQKTLLVVEWPELLPDVAWGAHLNITLAVAGRGKSRRIDARSLS